jgi:hypothetical protein
LGLLSKWSLAVLAPLVVLAIVLAPGSSWRTKLVHIAVAGVIAILVGGWPFLGNLLEYGDPLATQARLAVKSEIESPLAHIPFFWLDRGYVGGLFDSLWGVFGLRNMQLPGVAYIPYYVLLLMGVLLSLYSLRRADAIDRKVVVVLLLALVLIYAGVAYQNTQFWAVQGRLLLPGLAAMALLVGRGMASLLELLHVRARAAMIVTSLVLLGLLALNIYALAGRLIPAYYG